jgi:hypothetical protein
VLEIAAGVATLGGLAVATVAALSGLALAGAVVFAGSRRLALVVIVVVALGGVAGLSAADSRRSSISTRTTAR